MSERLQRIADIISLLKDAEWECRLDDEALDIIEAAVAGAKIESLTRRWGSHSEKREVVGWQVMKPSEERHPASVDTQPSIHPNMCGQGESTPHVDDNGEKCGECGGKGKVWHDRESTSDIRLWRECPTCHGEGTVPTPKSACWVSTSLTRGLDVCEDCKGTGEVE